MKMTKLLAGVAVAAMISGAASAQVTSEIRQGNTDAPNLSGVPFAGDNIFVSEAGSLAGLSVPLEFSIEPGGTSTAFTGSPNVEVLLSVSVTNAVLDRSLGDTDIVGGGANCLDPELTVDAGGVAGQSSVTFRIADIGDCDANTNALPGAGDENLQFAFPLLLSGGDVQLSYEMRRAADNSLITSGTWSANEANATFAPGTAVGPLIGQMSAFDVTLGSDFAVADVAAGPPAFSAFTADDTLAAALNLGFSGALMPIQLGPLTPFAAVGVADLDDVDTVCTYENATGLDIDNAASTLGTAVPALVSTTQVTYDLIADITGANLAMVLSESAPAAAIRSQDISCSGTFDWDQVGNPALTGYSNVTFSGVVGYIRRNGIESGAFEWVGDATLSTGNVFRFTGIGASAPEATVIVTNSSTGLDGEYDFVMPAPVNGEIIVNNNQLTSQIGNFGRADIQFSLKQSPAPGNTVAIRRFLIGSNGTFTDFGNENDDNVNGNDIGIVPTLTATGGAGGGDN